MLRLVLVLYTSLCLACVGTCFAGSSKAKKPITLVTLDVDGTLLSGHSDAARKSVHAKAFNYAICKVFQPETKEKDGYVWSDEFATPEMVIPSEKYHGCTDGLIALNLAKYGFGVSSSEAFPKLEAVFGEMFDYVSKRSDEEVANGIEALPGVIDTLRVLAKNENILVGLVTGNVEGIARKKMRSCGITQTGALSPASPEQQKHWEGFMDEDSSFLGGFGSDFCSGDIEDQSRVYKDRAMQISIAVRRAISCLKDDEELCRVIHVGDAPADVLAAKWVYDLGLVGRSRSRTGERSKIEVGIIGVGTGKFSSEQLQGLMGVAKKGAYEPLMFPEGLGDPRCLDYIQKKAMMGKHIEAEEEEEEEQGKEKCVPLVPLSDNIDSGQM